jgi:hypothetical protein
MSSDIKTFAQEIAGELSYLQKEVWTLEECARYMGITPESLMQLNHKGAITYSKPSGGRCYYLKEDVIRYLTNNKIYSQKDLQDKAHEKTI